jgi:tellurite resistance protein TerC
VELTDIIFAVDSVPAVLAVSPDRFIAYSSNVFAILGLRALFFVYHAVESKFWALNWALSGVLAWIGFKMAAAPFGLHVPVGISLAILAVFLAGGVIVSMVWPREQTVSAMMNTEE